MARLHAASCAVLMAALGLLPVSARAQAVVHPDIWPAQPPGMLIRPETEAFVDQLLARMSLEDKIGQMIQADIDAIKPEDLATYHLGSILAGGNAAPGGDVHADTGAWLDLTDRFYRASLAPGDGSHQPIPILFGIDAVHGNAKIRGATIFPHNVGLGAAHDPALMERIGRATAEEVAAAGVDWTFAPTLAVVRDPRWGRSYESYSEEPSLVARYAGAMVAGLQGKFGTPDFMAPGHTLASAKHFLGDGGTVDGRDQGDDQISESELARIHAAGYPAAIAAGAMIVMGSYNGWQGVKMHGDHGLLTDVLKARFGFGGFVVGDWNAHEEIPGCTKLDCPAAIMAGVDMLMAPDGWRELYANTLAEARSQAIPPGRIDEAVRRILRVKALAGLFQRPAPKDRPGAGDVSHVGSAEHRALAREAVRKSLVLLKNEKGLLPLDPHGRILVAGDAADNLGDQTGGWTVDWQGDRNHNEDFPGATSIYGGLKAAVEAAGGTIRLRADGSFAERPDAAIVVFGEGPYAEYQGDRETLEFSPHDRRALALLKRLKAKGIPVVALFLSGRPLWVDPELNAADAFVAAWLPGSEGEGIADVLLRNPDGSVHEDFTGKLGFSWPRTAMPVRFDAEDRPVDALFPRGFGLTYADHASLPALPEDPQVPARFRAPAGSLFHAGHVTAPWSIYLEDALAEVRLTMARQVSPKAAVEVSLQDETAVADWRGGARGLVKFTGRARDLKAAAHRGDAVSLRFRVDVPPAGRVEAVLGCGKGCRPAMDVSRVFAEAPVGQWRTMTLPLACFALAGADLDAVDMPVALATDGRFKLALSEAAIVPGHGNQGCPEQFPVK
ncbi:MAG TPA: glycoside hydrolase family 3 N-terminal domain-containing protein [Aliidongia sp.]|nr:glycoside hydrolase family 3 N-terminal domain-containing protein [Aliidongia sp.]